MAGVAVLLVLGLIALFMLVYWVIVFAAAWGGEEGDDQSLQAKLGRVFAVVVVVALFWGPCTGEYP